ncbi:DUF1700 domain-containing protein [Clostridium aestuarii]|uniref:DUF1700 domain-containing protein n=1 Tax=Clostridium aestuarii TaxID=338193 RepID=A0ABT4D0U6_9CLOT|nr:DUF1700 domain-containing protein [Clostridium aestuarii]MCY6484722.1 DUF1700 domain-containing protein [Clostridium aestuarii]
MSKNKFMLVLSKQLKNIPELDRKEILSDYEEHFRLGIQQGRDEEEIAQALGEPNKLAKIIKTEYAVNTAEKNTTISNIFKIMITATGLGFFNLFFVPIVFIGGGSIIFGLYALVFGVFISGGALALSPILKIFFPQNVHNPLNPLLSIPLGIVVCFLSYYLFKGMNILSKKFGKFLLNYIKGNINIIKNNK